MTVHFVIFTRDVHALRRECSVDKVGCMLALLMDCLAEQIRKRYEYKGITCKGECGKGKVNIVDYGSGGSIAGHSLYYSVVVVYSVWNQIIWWKV